MNTIQFPVNFTFKVTSLANDFEVKDANDQVYAYVRQKMFKFIDEIKVYSDTTKENLLFTINANKWLDFSAAYTFTNAQGLPLGKVARKGWASIWKARYEVFSVNDEQKYMIREENAWIKVFDALLNEIPILGIFTGYLFNPAYRVTDMSGKAVIRLKKEPSFWGRKFNVTKTDEYPQQETELILLSLMMMILLERRRG